MQIHPIGSSPTMTVVCEGHRRRLTPPSNLWLVCEGALARARAMWVSAVYFSVGEAWKARKRERTLSA